MIFSIPRFLIDLIRNHQSSLSKKQLTTTKILLIDSAAKIGSSMGAVSFGITRAMIAGLKVPLGAIDQLGTLFKFLTQKLSASPRVLSISKQHKKTQNLIQTIARRASFSASMDNFLSIISAKISLLFKLRTAQKITQGQKNLKNILSKTIEIRNSSPLQGSSETADSVSLSIAELSPRKKPHGAKVSPVIPANPALHPEGAHAFFGDSPKAQSEAVEAFNETALSAK
jgi:hypothetical protein